MNPARGIRRFATACWHRSRYPDQSPWIGITKLPYVTGKRIDPPSTRSRAIRPTFYLPGTGSDDVLPDIVMDRPIDTRLSLDEYVESATRELVSGAYRRMVRDHLREHDS